MCNMKHGIYVYIHKYILIYILKKIEETIRKNRIRVLKHKNWFHVITQELNQNFYLLSYPLKKHNYYYFRQKISPIPTI